MADGEAMSYSTEQDNEGSLSSGVPQNSQEEEMEEEASSSSDSCDEEEAESAEISTLRSRVSFYSVSSCCCVKLPESLNEWLLIIVQFFDFL